MKTKAKKLKTENYLIIGGLHLGVNDDILRIYQNVAKMANAKVFHLGPLLSDDEMKRAKTVTGKIMTTEREYDERAATMKDQTREAMDEKLSSLQREMDNLANTERARAGTLTGHFSDVTFVIPSGGSLSKRIKGAKVIEQDCVLSKYLLLSGVQPVTDKSTLRPTNRNTIMHLQRYGGQYSWIVPHPVPATVPYARPGVNNVHNYYTTGCLRHTEKPTSRSESYKTAHMPCAVLVQINVADDTFQATHLHIDYAETRGYARAQAMVLYDGLMFTASGVKEVKSEDRAVFETDDHDPNYHPGVLGAVRALNELFRPGTFINGGDATDGAPVNHHEMRKAGKMEGRRIKDMISGLRKLLTAQANVDSIKTRVMLDSNHADWLTDFVDANPALQGMLDWESLQKTVYPDWYFILRKEGSQEIYTFGDYTIRHGDRENLERAELIFRKGKYLCGHWHRYMGFRRTLAAGCGGHLAPAYIENEVNAWQNMIVSLTRFQGITAVAPKIVLHDKKRPVSRFAYRFCFYETSHYVTK